MSMIKLKMNIKAVAPAGNEGPRWLTYMLPETI